MPDSENIRPYLDTEVDGVIAKLLTDEQFILAIRRLRFHYLPSFFDRLLLPISRLVLRRQLEGTQTLLDFQRRMVYYLEYMVKTQVDHLTVSGLEALEANNNYLFISNHRDITLDAALVDSLLLRKFNKTLRIAVGDNLLNTDFVRMLLRLNKCFSVNRSQVSPRTLIKHLQQLSAYIRFCLEKDEHSVWLAQSEGRTKDGLDKTSPALIKMLVMSKPPATQLSNYIKQYNILPVAVSYEYDPCDLLKAQELYTLATTGQYIKSNNEDFISIGKGILGYKGNVHISFGTPLNGEYTSPDEVAQHIDQQIINNYRLHTSNLLAFELLHGELPATLSASYSTKDKRVFMQRLDAVPQYLRSYWLAMYANPVVSKIVLTDT